MTCKIWINCIEQIYLKVLTVEIGTVWAILSPECNKALVDWGEKASGEGRCLVHKGNVEQTGLTPQCCYEQVDHGNPNI